MYTEEETKYLADNYPTKTVEQLALELEKSPRSIIGKLSRMGIYQKKQYVDKRGERPVTKLELCAQLAQALGLRPEALEGLEKAPKEVLRTLVAARVADDVDDV